MKYADHQKELEKQEGMATIPAVVRNAVFKRAAASTPNSERTDYLHAATTEYRELARLVKRAYKAGEKVSGTKMAEARIRFVAGESWQVHVADAGWVKPSKLRPGSDELLVWGAFIRTEASTAASSATGVTVRVTFSVEVQP